MLILHTVKSAVLESKWNHTIPFHKSLHLMQDELHIKKKPTAYPTYKFIYELKSHVSQYIQITYQEYTELLLTTTHFQVS